MTHISPAPESAPAPTATDERTLPVVTYVLYLLGFATCALTTVIGLIIAYANRDAASESIRSHYTFLIRTFWMTIGWFVIGALVFAISVPLSFILIGIPGLILGGAVMSLVGLWFAVRCIVGLVFLAQGQAYPRPYSWII